MDSDRLAGRLVVVKSRGRGKKVHSGGRVTGIIATKKRKRES